MDLITVSAELFIEGALMTDARQKRGAAFLSLMWAPSPSVFHDPGSQDQPAGLTPNIPDSPTAKAQVPSQGPVSVCV